MRIYIYIYIYLRISTYTPIHTHMYSCIVINAYIFAPSAVSLQRGKTPQISVLNMTLNKYDPPPEVQSVYSTGQYTELNVKQFYFR